MYHGDISLGDTIDIRFTTRRFTTGAPFSLASGTVACFAGNGTSGITTGVTLSADLGSVTGRNNVRIVASSGNGFATATNYSVEITVGTVDSVSVVGEVIGSFSIENRSALRPTTAGRTLAVESDGMAHADVKEWLGVAPLALSSQQVQAVVPVTQKVDVETIKTNAVVNGGTVTFPTNATLASTTNITAATGIVLSGVTHTGAVIPTVTTLTGHTAQTGDTFALANGVNGFVATKADTAAILVDTGTSGVIVATNNDKTGYALVSTGLDAIASTATGMVEIAKAIWDRVLTGATHNIATSAGRRLRQIETIVTFSGTIDGTPSATVIPLDTSASATNDFYVPGLIVVVSSFGTQFRRIASYVGGATQEVTVATPFTTVPADTDPVIIIPWASVRVSDIDADVVDASALATDAVDEIRDAILSDSTPFAGANVDATLSSRATPAQVNAEIVDALATDTYAEPTGVPGATVSLSAKISRLYQALRNGLTVTATNKTFQDDAGSDLWKKPLSDDTTTYTEGEGTTP